MKQKTAFFLLISILISLILFCGCSSDKAQTALSYKGYTVSEGEYAYWFDSLKSYYVNYYSDISDTAEFWNTEYSEGKTYGQYMDEKIETQICCYLVGQQLFDEYGLTLPDETVTSIQEDIDSQITYYGSKSAFNKELKPYGLNVSDIKKIYTMEEKFLYVNDYLYDEDNGILKLTDEEIDEYYKENYVRIKYYMILRNKEYAYDEDGKHLTDSSGYYKYNDLTEEQIKEKEEYAKTAYKDISEGGNIDDYIQKDYPDLDLDNGYYVTVNDYSIHTSTVIDAAFSMEIGECRLVSNEDAFFIICKYDLIDKAYEGADKDQFSKLSTYASAQKFNAMFEELIKGVVKTEDIVSKYTVNNSGEES